MTVLRWRLRGSLSETPACPSGDPLSVIEHEKEIRPGKQQPGYQPPEATTMLIFDVFINPSCLVVNRSEGMSVFPLPSGA
jgi:hypothetical protein